jgi:hypothetical protein
MGDEITTQVQETKATPEERELNELQLERARAAQPGQIGIQQAGLDVGQALLRGQALPGYLEPLPGGISEESISRMVGQSLEDVASQANVYGILDSGVAQELATETAADIRARSEQFNLQNLAQLLNLAVGGQAQIQSPLLTQTSQLGTQLAGLRTGTTQLTQMNPFLKSFQESAGEGFGNWVDPQTYIKPQ